ncbi:hypothetical protein K1T71_010938 [Dendrolimus kikuchii]|uniref:Uncharacterized protein n=1 Tax=Dendrolimus kikuchii TaxID=765133 RepID=A0ACC1CQ96_9NEOP|nr:hypothetical protein K1T71_010938 [Dendrolimus kikuchii]
MNQESILACCAVCNQKTHRRCGRCLNIYYCNTEHQRQDWKRHKSECAPKLPKQGSKSNKSSVCAPVTEGADSRDSVSSEATQKSQSEVINPDSVGSTRRSRKSKTKGAKTNSKEGNSDGVSKHNPIITSENANQGESSTRVNESSVISSVVYTNKELNSESAITYEGSSEQEILSASEQQLSTVDFATPTTTNVLRAVNRADEMPVLPEQTTRVREYPAASLGGSPAPFNHAPNTYYMDPNDRSFELCQRVIRDMTQYGVCVLNNFLGKERGLLVLNEVLDMYRSGIFSAGQLVSNPGSTEAQTIRSDRITWIDGKEPHCFYIRQLINEVDKIILRANKMPNNGKMGDYNINGRTKNTISCGRAAHRKRRQNNPQPGGRAFARLDGYHPWSEVCRHNNLELVFPEGTNQVADIAPIFDRMLFFWSDRRNPHEVQPAYGTRYAITLWYFDAQERAEALRHFKERGQPSSSK